MGRWDCDRAEFHKQDEHTLVLRNAEHEGPVFKFPLGMPASGDVVVAQQSWDICENLGVRRLRPRVRLVIRVKPATRPETCEHQSLRIGSRDDAKPWRSIQLLHADLVLYCDDGKPFDNCPVCNKRKPVGQECCPVFELPSLPSPAMWTAAQFLDEPDGDLPIRI